MLNVKSFQNINLNLIVAFAALMRERSLTRAGQALLISQPSMSRHLKELRRLLEDDLFVRNGHGVTPTQCAKSLYEDLSPSLQHIEFIINERRSFDPRSSQRRFRVGLGNALEITIVPLLLQRISHSAPQVSIVARQTDRRRGLSQIDQQDIDVALAELPKAEAWHREEDLGQHALRCLFDGKRLGLANGLSLSQFSRMSHVLHSGADDWEATVDAALTQLGLARRILVSTSDYAKIPFYLTSGDTVATLPGYAAVTLARVFGLTSSVVPLQPPAFRLSMVWHQRNNADAGHAWFRGLVRDTVANWLASGGAASEMAAA